MLYAKMFVLVMLTSLSNLNATNWFLQSSDNLNSYKDRLLGQGAKLISQFSLFAPLSTAKYVNEDVLFKLSELKAKHVFWDAYTTVPAYSDFIEHQCPEGINCFSDIPLMSKDNYIKQYPIEQTLKDGVLPAVGNMDPSSGTSGRRTLWIRGKFEIDHDAQTMRFAFDTLLSTDNYILINMFLPSAWTFGLMRPLGPNIAEAYETLKDLGTGQKYLIMGHTALMRLFVENCPFDLSQYDITLLIGGEHMSRALHQYFLDKGINQVFAGYGASDIHFTVGLQAEFTQELQKLCWNNPELKKDLTGSENGLPYFFQYNPLQDYVEVIDGRLVFTVLNTGRVSPRVRYDLGDRGTTLKMSFVREVLEKHGIDIEPVMNLPLICLYGRVEHMIMYKNAELAFDDLELAVLAVPELAPHMNQYGYNQFKDSNGVNQLEFWVELKPDVWVEQFDQEQLQTKVIDALGTINHVFKKEYAQNAQQIPLKIFEYGKSPMLEKSIFRKAKFVYNMPH